MFDFEKLDVYKKAKNFNRELRNFIRNSNGLDTPTKNQLTRASMSIQLNIAEGSGRFTKPDKRRFFIMARGSVFECVSILDYLHDEDALITSEFHRFHEQGEELSKMLFKMIKLLGE